MTSPAFDAIVAHYHEVGLKGKNRNYFEHRLVGNIRTALSETDYQDVKLVHGRIVIWLIPGSDYPSISDHLCKVFGLVHFSPALHSKADLQTIVDRSLELATASRFSTFAVRARKGNSSFEESSQRVNEVVGQAIKDTLSREVDLSRPDWTCHIELVGDRALIYGDKIEGPGGLPVGVSGRVLSLLSGGIDSPVAAWEIAKRGARVDFIHFHGQPFSDPSSVRQAGALAKHLRPWTGPSKLWTIPFGDIQAEIVTSAPQELRIVLYRRFMIRIAEALATREGAEALVTGESLGQVASQTLRNIRAINDAARDLPILRPLVGRDKVEIEALARKIGSYEISIQPHQDCCVLFVPRRVTTFANLQEIVTVEDQLDVKELVDRGMEQATIQGPR